MSTAGKPTQESHLARVARERREAKPIKYVSKRAKAQAERDAKLKPISYKAKVSNRRPLMISLRDLKFHPLLKRVAMLPELIDRETKLGKAQGKSRAAHKAIAEEMSHDFSALVESVSRHGIREKLKVIHTPKGYQIVDGRHRFEAAVTVATTGYEDPARNAIARKFAAEGVACELVKEDEVIPIIMDAVTRRHMSKGARAYLAVLMQPTVVTEAKAREKSGKPSAFSAEGLAARAGVSVRLVEDAIALYRQFEARGDVRKKFEDAIWVGAGLAKLRAGIEGYLKTGKEPEEEPETEAQARARIAQERVESALKVWTGVTTTLKHWKTMPAAGREEVIRIGVETILETPAEFRAALTAALDAR